MQRVVGGYTILEVMIVLAISALLFFSAMIVVGGQTGKTNFNQAMQDVSSKINNYVSQISASSYPGSEAYSCSVVNGRAQLSTLSPGTNAQCIFIGKAFQVRTGQSNIYVYTVLANVDQYSGNTDTGQAALTISTANPEPAMSGGNFVLMDTYQLGAGAKIVSSRIVDISSGAPSESDLVGIYTGLPNDSTSSSSGTSALIMKGYPCTTSPSDTCPIGNPVTTPLANTFAAKGCIEEGNVPNVIDCTNPPIVSKWTVCISDGSTSTGKASLVVNSAPGGVTSQIIFAGCS